MSSLQCFTVRQTMKSCLLPAAFNRQLPVVFVLFTASVSVLLATLGGAVDVVTSACPAGCSCRPVAESPPCDWCSSAASASTAAAANSDLSTPTSSSSSSSSSAGDGVMCEGCGAAAGADSTIDGGQLGVRSRLMQAMSRPLPMTPSTDRPETVVSCIEAGLTTVPFQLPASTSTLDLTGNLLRRLEHGFLEFAPAEIETGLSDSNPSKSESDLMLSAIDFDGPQLVNLRLRKNRIEYIASGSFRSPSAASIRVLDLADNRLTKVNTSMFAGAIADSLEQLDLSDNAIRDLGDGAFSTMKRLVRLDLHDNSISELGPGVFRGLFSLKQLVLAGNQIKTFDRRTFKPLEKLVYIVLKGNPIGYHEPLRFQFNSISLTYVDLSECQLSEVPKGLPGSARYVQLRRNNITSISKSSFIEAPHINILICDDNDISEVEDGSFERLIRLQQLWMGGNRLQKIPTGLSASVRRLLLDFNQIENVTDAFPRGSQMTALSLTGNRIGSIARDAFVKLTMLRTLDLANNYIRVIEPDTFMAQSSLRTLQLSGNPIESIATASLSGLTSLSVLSLAYVSSNEIRIDPNALVDVGHSLVRLDIDGSPAIAEALFKRDSDVAGAGAAVPRVRHRLLAELAPVVQELNVRSSNLMRLRPEDLPNPLFRLVNGSVSDVQAESPQSTAVLRISSSWWHCDADLVWLRDWLLRSAAEFGDSSVVSPEVDADRDAPGVETTVDEVVEDQNKCATPRRLHGRLLTTLRDEEFETVVRPPRTTTMMTSHYAVTRTTTTVGSVPTPIIVVSGAAAAVSTTPVAERPRARSGNSINSLPPAEQNDTYVVQRPLGGAEKTAENEDLVAYSWDPLETDGDSDYYLENERNPVPTFRNNRRGFVFDVRHRPTTITTLKDSVARRTFQHPSPSVPTTSSGFEGSPVVTRRSTHQGRAVGVEDVRFLIAEESETESETESKTSGVTLYAAIATVGATIVVAVIILIIIIRLLREKKNAPAPSAPQILAPACPLPEKPLNQTDIDGCSINGSAVIEHRHPNGLLYFSRQLSRSHQSSPISGRHLPVTTEVSTVASIDDHLRPPLISAAITSGNLSLSPIVGNGYNVKMTSMTLMSANVEPLPTYKWQDF